MVVYVQVQCLWDRRISHSRSMFSHFYVAVNFDNTVKTVFLMLSYLLYILFVLSCLLYFMFRLILYYFSTYRKIMEHVCWYRQLGPIKYLIIILKYFSKLRNCTKVYSYCTVIRKSYRSNMKRPCHLPFFSSYKYCHLF